MLTLTPRVNVCRVKTVIGSTSLISLFRRTKRFLSSKSSFCMRNFLETRQTTAGKNTGQCLTHVNKLACEIWSCFHNVQFSQKLNLRVLPSRLQLSFQKKILSAL